MGVDVTGDPAQSTSSGPRTQALQSQPHFLLQLQPRHFSPTPSTSQTNFVLDFLSPRTEEKLPPTPHFDLPSECPVSPSHTLFIAVREGGQLTGCAWNRCGGSGD
jgi:hypothetical protein